MGSRLVPLRTLLQQGSLAATRAIAVASLRELPLSLNLATAAQPTTLSQNRHPAYASLWQSCNFHATAGCGAGVQVKVPALGESITDGAISMLLKKPGDAVAEDEPIMQIETDKVVIDVRAPHAGVLEQFLVKENDNVVVGQPIAIIGSGEGGAAPQPEAEAAAAAPPPPAAAAAPPQPPKQQQPAPSFAASATAALPAAAPKRQPLIKFPPRRTEAGDVISSMPAAKAKAYLEALAKAAAEAAKPRPTIAPLITTRSGAPLPRPPRQLVRPAPQVPRSAMSDREMEAIMLGGAEP